ncbi:MAG: SRPBCC family protein [Candidatus Dormibacter sp.]
MIGAHVVDIRRRLPAPASEVFRWWTDPERLREWITPVGTVEADVDLRVGGALRIVMKGDGRVIEHTGRYLEVDPPRRLVFTWVSPYTGPTPSLVTIELQPVGSDETDLHLIHSQLPDDAASTHREGWGAMLDRLTGCLNHKEGIPRAR